MKSLDSYTGTIIRIRATRIKTQKSFLDIASRYVHKTGTVVLLSGGQTDSARYNILAVQPWLSLCSYGLRNTLKLDNHDYKEKGDPFELLKSIINTYSWIDPYQKAPIVSGLFGYLAYDLKDHLENLPKTCLQDLPLPQMCMYAPSYILVEDIVQNNKTLYFTERTVKQTDSCQHDPQLFENLGQDHVSDWFQGKKEYFSSTLTKNEYKRSVDQVKDYIISGDVYQVNISQRFCLAFQGNPFSLFKDLFQNNPAPFYAYINCGDHQIVSTSPERFLFKKGLELETRPIKGTIQRGKTQEEDQELAKELIQSPKDTAELSMIVDLLRNDLGKVCQAGTVCVHEHKRLEKYKNVFHLVSIIKGTMGSNQEVTDLIKACFPGGSITGCPKIRSMEIIDELEPVQRHIYTGSIGYISFHETMDLSIAIRTATIYNQRIFFSVGGGIVYDSKPEKEFAETIYKGETLMQKIQGGQTEKNQPKYLWFNGKIIPEDMALIQSQSPGAQYGYGLFETIRVDEGKIHFLIDHIRRLYRSWKVVFQQEPPELDWKEIIDQVISQNHLDHQTAVVKLSVWKNNGSGPYFFPYDLSISANSYQHRLKKSRKSGLELLTYPEYRQSPLADHKSMNYLYYFLAGNWAKEKGGDEALICNPDGSISETNTGNILVVFQDRIIIPSSDHVLPGIIVDRACQILKEKGFRVEQKTLESWDLLCADQVLISNSLLGVIPVLSLDKTNLPVDSQFSSMLNFNLFGKPW